MSLFCGASFSVSLSFCLSHSLSFFPLQTAFMEARKQTWRQSWAQTMVTRATLLFLSLSLANPPLYRTIAELWCSVCVSTRCPCTAGVFFFLLEQALLESIQTTSVVSLGHLESVWVEVSWFECKIQTAEKVIGMLGMFVLLPLHGCSGSFAVYFGLANKSETFAAPCCSSVYPWDDYFSLKACRVLQDDCTFFTTAAGRDCIFY